MRLTTLKPTIKPLAPRLGFAPGDRQAFDKARYIETPWRKWYAASRWQALRQQVLIRDHYTCQQTGILCGGRPNEPDSPVVHHKTPHKGDERLFWSLDNLECVSKSFHDAEAQRQERAEAARR